MRRWFSLLRLTGVFVLYASINLALSTDARAATERSQAPVTADTLQAKIKEVEATTDLNDETRNKLVELYRKTLSYLEKVSSSNTVLVCAWCLPESGSGHSSSPYLDQPLALETKKGLDQARPPSTWTTRT